MKLSKFSAEQIVKEVGSLIEQHVNIMDHQGYIIASTDSSRVGSFHEAAKKVIEDQMEELVILDENLFEGVKKGINCPIVFEGEIVGVVGITGEYQRVAVLGQIIRKMVEILLRDEHQQRQMRSSEQARRQYLEAWLYGEEALDESFISRGLSLGIDISWPRRIMAVALLRSKRPEDVLQAQEEMEDIEKMIRTLLRTDPEAIVFPRGNRFILGVSEQSNKRLLELFETIKNSALEQHGATLVAGADIKPAQGKQAQDACHNAENALKTAMIQNDSNLSFYSETALELLLSEIPDYVKDQYVGKLFAGCSPEALKGWIQLLEVYFRSEGSVSKTAEQLFIHKNTLQYKLRKLKEITGYDPRTPEGASCLFIALQVFHDTNPFSAIVQ